MKKTETHKENATMKTKKNQSANARMVAAAPDLLYALKEAKLMLETAKAYFPKSIKNRDRFSLLNVLANAVDPAIAKAEARKQKEKKAQNDLHARNTD